jgi:hypothetical protein
VDNDVQVGAGVRIQTGVDLCVFTIVDDDVFIGPGAITTNDDTMARHGPRSPRGVRRCGAPVASVAARCSHRASRSAKRRSWPPVRSWRAMSCRERS